MSGCATRSATWKIWGNTTATLDMRADPQNLAAGLTKPWPGAGYAGFARRRPQHRLHRARRNLRLRPRHGITGFATVAGDRHSFWAGLAAKSLPPKSFEPVGIAFVTGSISAPGLVEAFEHVFPERPSAARALSRPGSQRIRRSPPQPAAAPRRALVPRVREDGDLAKARAVSNPDLSPHLSFVDMGGHGYAVVRASQR